MKVSPNKVAVLAGGDATLSVDTNAAGVADDLTGHVLRRVDFLHRRYSLPTNGPPRDVVRPLVRRYRRWLFTVAGKKGVYVRRKKERQRSKRFC